MRNNGIKNNVITNYPSPDLLIMKIPGTVVRRLNFKALIDIPSHIHAVQRHGCTRLRMLEYVRNYPYGCVLAVLVIMHNLVQLTLFIFF